MITVKQISAETGYSERHIRRKATELKIEKRYEGNTPGAVVRVFTPEESTLIKTSLTGRWPKNGK